jgi:hypothetical protein
MARSERAPRREDSLKGTVAAQRANSIIVIICIHKDCEEEEGRFLRKSWAAPMRQLHSATFSSCSACSLGPCWGSFGGMKTCSTTERRMLGSGQSSTGEGMTVENETVDVAMMRGRIDHPSPSPRPYKSHVFDVCQVSRASLSCRKRLFGCGGTTRACEIT